MYTPCVSGAILSDAHLCGGINVHAVRVLLVSDATLF